MDSPITRLLVLLAIAVGLFALAPRVRIQPKVKDAAAAPVAVPSIVHEPISYEEVLPVLTRHCWKCHGADPEKIRGGLDLTTRKGVLEGGDSGPAVNLANPADSLLLKAIHYKDDQYRMPPKSKLPDGDIAKLERWVFGRVRMPVDPKDDAVTRVPPKSVVTEEAKRYWAYQPVKRPAVPEVNGKKWVRSPIDAFVLAKLEAKGLRPVKPADKAVLIRRATYDLTGLPPTPEDVDAFVNSADPNAYEKLIDRLLASPQYGEKWGRHWLDVVRYAETNGHARNYSKPHVWRYRDYVIKSFNADKPYDQFIKEQLAGDEMPGYNPDAVVATGYYRLGQWDDDPADREQAVFDGYDDIVATTGQAFLGATFNCARCHDHKVDPIPQADYYKLVAFVRDIRPFSSSVAAREVHSKFNITDITPPERRAAVEVELKQQEARLAEVKKVVTATEDEILKTLPAEDQRAAAGGAREEIVESKVVPLLKGKQKDSYAVLKKELAEWEENPCAPSQQLALSVNNCDRNPPATHVLLRGSPVAKGKEVKPGFPEVLGLPEPTIPAPKPGAKSSGRRTVLAEWVASRDNPFTARVFVNRVWQYHFGRGIVPTANDFGKLGEQPTHPELLDWLASEFVDGGWKLKRLHKLIMLSGTYQLSSAGDADNLKADPANALLWRFNMRRLSGEEVRDSILAVSGSLNPKQFGPSADLENPKTAEESNRRSVYARVNRASRVPILVAFDQPLPDTSCPMRYVTTVPAQSLALLNGAFANEQAAAFARRLVKESPNDIAAQVTRAIRLTTGRVPAPDEVQQDVAFIRRLKAGYKLDDAGALARYCLLCLNTNEFVYLD